MYVRDELGDFSECAYSLLLSISFLLTHREAVTGYPASHRLAAFPPLMGAEMRYGSGTFIRWMAEGCGAGQQLAELSLRTFTL